jgi:hypothetical protein
MSFIYEALSSVFQRELCASDDCIVIDPNAPKVTAPLVDIAIGESTVLDRCD